jgi:hypothetical protein
MGMSYEQLTLYEKDQAGTDRSSDGDQPGISYSHGFCRSRVRLEFLQEHLAEGHSSNPADICNALVISAKTFANRWL